MTDPVVVPKLFSVGLFEEATTPSAWPGTSFAGGAELMFQGEGMSHLPSDKTIIFENSALGILKGGPALSCKFRPKFSKSILLDFISSFIQISIYRGQLI